MRKAAWLLLGSANLCAQTAPPQGTGAPTQMRQRMLDRIRQRLEVQDDAEWKLISDRLSRLTGVQPPVFADLGPKGRHGDHHEDRSHAP
jgi:hypothetical protein